MENENSGMEKEKGMGRVDGKGQEKDALTKEESSLTPQRGSLEEKIDQLALHMEKVRMAEYFELLTRPRRLFLLNFLAGMARGFGFAVGFTLLGALGIFILQSVVQLNLPLIGDFIAEIVEYVLESRGLRP